MKAACMMILGMFCANQMVGQRSIEKIWETDTMSIHSPESVLFDPASGSLYVSNMATGNVCQLTLDGKVSNPQWITGLSANKGSAIYNGHYYTAETNTIAVIDTKTKAIVQRILVDGAGMLNDVAMNANGVLYVSDTRNGKVYRIIKDRPEIYLENIPGANGLLLLNDDLYVLSATSVLKIDTKKTVTTVADGFESGLDGIVDIGNNEFILSNYKGILYYLAADGKSQVLSDTRKEKIAYNDISYNKPDKILYVPSFTTNKILAYRVK